VTDPLSPPERALLEGRALDAALEAAAPDAATLERWRGLAALAGERDLDAVAHLRRSVDALPLGSLERAVSERLYGLALIRALREVEGTFALERADAVLDALGVVRFGLED
jgi:hypothetical protein